MSEALFNAHQSINEYQAAVVATRRDDLSGPWDESYHDLILDEFLELSGQHGPALFLLKDARAREWAFEENPEIVEGAKEELGDLLWFGVSVAEYLGESAKDLSVEALEARTARKIGPVQTLTDLQEEVAAGAPKIKVITKWGLGHPEASEQSRYTTLFESPDYCLRRAVFRLTRSLTNGRHDVAPYTGSMMEPLVSPRLALGDYINAVVYAARRVGVDIEEIAKDNIDKLQARQVQNLT